MEAGQLRVRFEILDSACVIAVGGELTVITAPEFTARVARTLAVFPGPVFFDVSGLGFVDCHGARALAGAVRAVPPRETGLYGCRPEVRRMLGVLGLDLPYVAALVRDLPVRPQQTSAATTPPSRGDALAAVGLAEELSARRSAAYSGDVLSRLAATYADLALNSRYRTPGRSAERRRLLALSGRARELSRQHLKYGNSDAG